MKKSSSISIEELKELYLNQLWSKRDLCLKYGITYGSLNYLLYKNNITKRNNEPRKCGISKEDLYNAIYHDKLTNYEIMKKFNICEQTLRKLIDYYDIPRRWNYERWESKCIQMYINERMSLRQIALILEIPKSRVRKILITNGVKLRSKSESQLTQHYSPNIIWYEPGPLQKKCRNYFSNHLVPKYKDRQCEMCGATEKLCLHHIIPFAVIIRQIINENKYINLNSEEGINEMYNIIINDYRYLDPLNLITVCEHCHFNIFHKKIFNSDNQHPSIYMDNINEGSTTIES